MKLDLNTPHDLQRPNAVGRWARPRQAWHIAMDAVKQTLPCTIHAVWVAWTCLATSIGHADSPTSHLAARQIIRQSITQFAAGEAFNAKVRQRVWVAGREVVGVGTYEQAGAGTGQFNLQITMHDGDGKHSLQQVSDGRLAWTRQEIAGHVSLRRVDVGRLDQWIQPSSSLNEPSLPPSVRIGAWTELLDRLAADYKLTVAPGTLEERSVWIIKGSLADAAKQHLLDETNSQELPELMPTQVVLAIARTDDPETKFGAHLPMRIEFRAAPAVPTASGDPTTDKTTGAAETTVPNDRSTPLDSLGPLITLMEMYAVRPIMPPPIARFRFDHQDAEVNFINETDRYLDRFQIQITERQSRSLRR